MNLNFNESSLFNEVGPSQENYNIQMMNRQMGGNFQMQPQFMNENPSEEMEVVKNDHSEKFLNLEPICELEKQIRSLEVEINVEKLKKENLKSLLEQKKKQMESKKSEIKRLKLNIEKMKDQINVLTRENELLNDIMLLNGNELN